MNLKLIQNMLLVLGGIGLLGCEGPPSPKVIAPTGTFSSKDIRVGSSGGGGPPPAKTASEKKPEPAKTPEPEKK